MAVVRTDVSEEPISPFTSLFSPQFLSMPRVPTQFYESALNMKVCGLKRAPVTGPCSSQTRLCPLCGAHHITDCSYESSFNIVTLRKARFRGRLPAATNMEVRWKPAC
jgi:hypothetical protein